MIIIGADIGVDEAGRGCLAGDVFAGAVYLHDNALDGLVKDSKKLSKKKREELFELIVNNYSYSLGRASAEEIDQINILQATKLAMRRAVDNLSVKNIARILVDGNQDPGFAYPTQTIIGGDDLVPSISAASIVAKVSRDKYMMEMADLYPFYNFAKHAGYGTKEHLSLLGTYGPCPIHRKTFAPVYTSRNSKSYIYYNKV
jgi:ribonuclease HII